MAALLYHPQCPSNTTQPPNHEIRKVACFVSLHRKLYQIVSQVDKSTFPCRGRQLTVPNVPEKRAVLPDRVSCRKRPVNSFPNNSTPVRGIVRFPAYPFLSTLAEKLCDRVPVAHIRCISSRSVGMLDPGLKTRVSRDQYLRWECCISGG